MGSIDLDIFISHSGSNVQNDNYDPGTYVWLTILHEIGHVLGLKHPFEDKGSSWISLEAAGYEDVYGWIGYSVMHYKNILVRTNEFITNLSYTSYGHQNKNFLESVKEMEINGHILTNNDWTSAMVLRKSLKPVFFQN